jgi:hypothetical protein
MNKEGWKGKRSHLSFIPLTEGTDYDCQKPQSKQRASGQIFNPRPSEYDKACQLLDRDLQSFNKGQIIERFAENVNICNKKQDLSLLDETEERMYHIGSV